MKTKVLLVAYGGGHAPMLVPVYRLLAASDHFEPTFLGLTTAVAVLERASIPHIRFLDLVEPGDDAALAWGRKLAERLPAGQMKVDPDETIAYLGLSYSDLVGQLGEAGAAEAFEARGRQALLPLATMERLFRRLQPGLVITTNSPRAEQAAILTARKLGVPALCLVDLFGEPDVRYVGKPGYADRLCVLSDYTKQFLVAAGRMPEEIVVTGNPAFDRWADPGLATRALELRHRKGWHAKKVLVWASQPEPASNGELPRQVDQELFRILRRQPEWHCVIRPHPSETVEYTELPVNASISTQDDDLGSLVAAADLLITFNSTLGLEAFMIGKPVVTVDLSVQCQYLPYSKLGISTGVDRLDRLEQGIQQALTVPRVSGMSIPPPGNAADRVLQVAVELVCRSQTGQTRRVGDNRQ